MGTQKKNPGLRAGVLLAVVLASSIAVVSIAAAQSTGSEGYLGVTTQTLTDELREGLDFKYTGTGALVSDVMDDGPAATAGIRQGDIITGIGSRAITSSSSLRTAVRGYKAGQTVSVKVVRGGQTRTFSVKLSEVPEQGDMEFEWSAPEPPDAPRAPRAPDAPHVRIYGDGGDMLNFENLKSDVLLGALGRGRLGVRVEDLSPELGEYFKGSAGKGALVMSVVADSPAKKAGIKPGDVITKVNDSTVGDSEDLVKALGKIEQGAARVTLVRKGVSQTLTAELPERNDYPHVMKMRGTPMPMRWYWNDDPRYRRRIEIHGDDPVDLHREIEELRREIDDLRRDLGKGDKN